MIRQGLLYVIVLIFGLSNVNAQAEYPISITPIRGLVDSENYKMVALPSLGLYFVVGNTLLAATDTSRLLTVTFPEEVYIDDIFWNENDFVIKSGKRVYLFDEIHRPLLEFDVTDFSIFPCDERSIYVARPNGEFCSLYKVNLKLKKARRMANLRGCIIDMSKRNGSTWVTTDAGVFRFDKDSCHVMLRTPSPILSATMTRLGLIYATDSSINYLIDNNAYVSLMKNRGSALSCDEQNLYFINDANDLVQISLQLIELSLKIIEAVPSE